MDEVDSLVDSTEPTAFVSPTPTRKSPNTFSASPGLVGDKSGSVDDSDLRASLQVNNDLEAQYQQLEQRLLSSEQQLRQLEAESDQLLSLRTASFADSQRPLPNREIIQRPTQLQDDQQRWREQHISAARSLLSPKIELTPTSTPNAVSSADVQPSVREEEPNLGVDAIPEPVPPREAHSTSRTTGPPPRFPPKVPLTTPMSSSHRPESEPEELPAEAVVEIASEVRRRLTESMRSKMKKKKKKKKKKDRHRSRSRSVPRRTHLFSDEDVQVLNDLNIGAATASDDEAAQFSEVNSDDAELIPMDDDDDEDDLTTPQHADNADESATEQFMPFSDVDVDGNDQIEHIEFSDDDDDDDDDGIGNSDLIMLSSSSND